MSVMWEKKRDRFLLFLYAIEKRGAFQDLILRHREDFELQFSLQKDKGLMTWILEQRHWENILTTTLFDFLDAKLEEERRGFTFSERERRIYNQILRDPPSEEFASVYENYKRVLPEWQMDHFMKGRVLEGTR